MSVEPTLWIAPKSFEVLVKSSIRFEFLNKISQISPVMNLRRSFVSFVFFVACLSCMGGALAQNLVIAQAYYVDKTGVLDFAQARTKNYIPFEAVLSRGYTESVTWLRVRIQHVPSSRQVRHIVLRIQPNYLDEVRLFDPLEPRNMPRVVGDRFLHYEQEYKSLFFSFLLPVSTEDREVWLRLKTASASTIGVDAYDEEQIRDVERRTLTINIILISLMVFYMLFVFFNWVFVRERLYLIFLFRTGMVSLLVGIWFGLFRELEPWIPLNSLDGISNILVITSSLACVFFEMKILQEYKLRQWTKIATLGLYAISGLSFLLLMLGFDQRALQLNAVFIGLSGWIFLFISLYGIKGIYAETADTVIHLHRNWVIFYYLCLCAYLAIMQLWILGEYQLKFISLTAPFYALASSTVLVIVILFRTHEIRKGFQKIELNLSLSMAREQAEQLRRREQSDLMHMLMHEIRNPLAVIDATQHTVSDNTPFLMRKNIDAIRLLLDRMLKIDQLSNDQFQLNPETFLFIDCLVQVMDDLHIDSKRLVLTGLTEDKFVRTDQGCLRVILGNLLGNAFKYSPSGTDVELIVEYAEDGFGVVVANSLSLGDVPVPSQVFDKYYRSERAKQLPGTGMGLYLVQQLVHRLGGECHCKVEGEIIRFEIWLPSNLI